MYDLQFPSEPQRVFTADAPQMTAMRGSHASAVVLARMLDIVDYGVLLVLDDWRVVFANQVARSELGDVHPLQLVGEVLLVRRPQDAIPLRGAVSNACKKGLQKWLKLADDGSSGAVTLSIVPMGDAAAGARPSAMLAFGKRKVSQDLSTEAFARHHGLTAAELRVLKQLCAGLSPAEIASQQGVALSTIRTQIGCAREKTGATSIGSLIRQVATLPPMQSVVHLGSCLQDRP